MVQIVNLRATLIEESQKEGDPLQQIDLHGKMAL